MPPLPTALQAGYYYDSDGDGVDDTYVPDPWEDPAYYGYTTPPADQDGDGWEDALDPFPADARLNPQTDPDADGVPSELEWFYGMNDLDPADGAADLDGDGFSNAEAFQQGWVLDAALVSPVPDLDGDRLNDITEAHWAQVHPSSLDPGNPLDPVADYDQDGVMNFEELTWGLDLASPTSNQLGDDLYFMQLATGNIAAFVTPGYPGYSATDPDADGLPSLLEYQLLLNPRSADSDEDGVPDGEEDSDGDGFGNLAEVAAGTLPGQAASHPVASSAGGTGGDGSGSTSGTGNEQGNGTGTTGSAAPPVGGTALAATTVLHLRVRSLKVSGGTITRHSQDEWIYSSGMGTSSEEMAAMKANGWDISDAFTMDIPTGTDPDGLPTGYETRYWWTAKKQVGVAGETILPFSGLSGVLASVQAVSEAYADEPGQVYQGDVSGELNLNAPASGDVFTGWEEGGGVKVVSEFAASKQSTPVSDTGLYPQGEAAEVWVEGFASEVAQRRTYLILTSSTAFQAEPDWQGVGTVTFVLEPGITGVGRVETMTGAAPWVTVHNGRLWVESPVQEGMRNEVRLLPVDLKEAWSDQITDVEANGMPDATGNNNRSYIIMGARQDGKGHAKLKLGSAIAADMRSKILWRLAPANTPTSPSSGNSTYDADGTTVRVTIDAGSIANADDKDYVVVVGYDQNGDGNLASGELLPTPKCMHDPPGGGANPQSLPFKFTVVSQARYTSSKQNNDQLAASVAGQFPSASELFFAFGAGTQPPQAMGYFDVKISRTETGLTHPIGIKFTPRANPGDGKRWLYNETNVICQDFVRAQRFKTAIKDNVLNNRHEEIAQYFADNPGEETGTFSWTWEELTGAIGHDCKAIIGILNPFEPAPNMQDVDMWLALGKVKINGTVTIEVHWINQRVTDVWFSGTVDDIYDFDYDDKGVSVPFLGDVSPARAAEVQAGFDTLGPGGGVFLHRLNYNTATEVPLTFDFFSL
ncbi:MAG: hypothetical protein R3F31_27925 [Verrucomicrobiales bacterium]